MGLYSFLAKLIILVIILAVSFVAVGLLLYLVDAASAAMGFRLASDSSFAQLSGDALLATATVIVFVFFTAPASLALVGHAGAWLRHVVSRSARYLGAAFVGACGLYIAGNAAFDVPFNLGGVGPGAQTVLMAAGAAALLLLLVSRTALVRVGGHLYEGVAGLSGVLRRRGLSRASVELKVTPTKPIREKDRPETIRGEAVKFQRLLQTLTSGGGRAEFRLSFRGGRGRVLISACDRASPEELQRRLLSMVKAHLSDYRPEACAEPAAPPGVGRRITISGIPEAVENPLEPLSRYFLENDFAGEYLLVMERRRANPLRRLAAKDEQRKTARKSGGQLTKQAPVAGDQRSAPVRDYAEEMRLEELMKVVERHNSPIALTCWVSVTAYAESRADAELAAKGASSVIMGALSGHRPATALRAGPPRDPPKNPGRHRGPTILLPSEAVPYVWIPQHAIGTTIEPSAEFEQPPELEGEILLGNVVSKSGVTRQEARIPLDDLKKHIFVVGMTGYGKTFWCISLLLQLWGLGVPWLVVEPVKSEYRTLLSRVRELQIFTLGDEGTAPFRLNIFEPPAGVRIQTHLENLVAVWNASYVMYSPTQYVLAEIVEKTYVACGWDLLADRRGRPITLDDLQRTTERVCRGLGYEPKVLMDIEAAIKTRISNLKLGGKGPMFDAVASVPVADLLRRPTVIELDRIVNDQEKAFVAGLLLTNVVEYVQSRGASKHLRHLTLIEEAHRLLPNVSTQKGDPEGADPRRGTVEQFAKMLAEIRAYGEGLAIVEQIPTKILPDAMKNTATKVAHRVAAADDRKALAGAMNFTEEQEEGLTALLPGQTIVSVEKHPFPIRVDAPDAVGKLGLPLGEVGDADVKRHMVDYYLRNPLPKAPPGLHREAVLEMVDTEWFRARFMEAYGAWLRTGETGPLAKLVTDGAAKFSEDRDERLEMASKILALAVGFYLPFDEKDRAKFPRVFMKHVERSMRDGRRA